MAEEDKDQFGGNDEGILQKSKKTSTKTWVAIAIVVVVIFIVVIVSIVSSGDGVVAKEPTITKNIPINAIKPPPKNLLIVNNTKNAIKNRDKANRQSLITKTKADNENYRQIKIILQQLIAKGNNMPTHDNITSIANQINKLDKAIDLIPSGLAQESRVIKDNYQRLINTLEQRLLVAINNQNNLPNITNINKPPFELMSVSLWDQTAQATIRFQGKLSIINVGDIRLGWKVQYIDFNSETIMVIKKGTEVIMEKIK